MKREGAEFEWANDKSPTGQILNHAVYRPALIIIKMTGRVEYSSSGLLPHGGMPCLKWDLATHYYMSVWRLYTIKVLAIDVDWQTANTATSVNLLCVCACVCLCLWWWGWSFCLHLAGRMPPVQSQLCQTHLPFTTNNRCLASTTCTLGCCLCP